VKEERRHQPPFSTSSTRRVRLATWTSFLAVGAFTSVVAIRIGFLGLVPLSVVGLAVVWRRRPATVRDRAGSLAVMQTTLLVALGCMAGLAAVYVDGVDQLPMISLPFMRPGATSLVLLVIFASVLNSIVEELIWRGLQFDLGQRLGFEANTIVVLSALSFGVAHWDGVPSGVNGALAAFLFGLLLGRLRLSSSLFAPIAVHFGADIVIFSFLTSQAIYEGGFQYQT